LRRILEVTATLSAAAALTVVAAQHRLWGVRVHAVRPNRDAIAVVDQLAPKG
jgi:dihydropteroate synthase